MTGISEHRTNLFSFTVRAIEPNWNINNSNFQKFAPETAKIHQFKAGFRSIVLPSHLCTYFQLISCTIVTYCGIRTWREITIKKRAVSRRTLDMQRQFFRALVVQTLIPICLLYLPLTTMLIAPIFTADLRNFDVIIQMAFVFYPILDPIAVLGMVRDYRRAIKAILEETFWKRFLSLISVLLPWIRNTRAITSPPASTIPAPAMPRFIY